ncbi:MAG: putative N-acetylglucosamine kinase, glucokinase-like [Rhodanobacteraceae bacterium]|nr:MAG: putative N-acetylglucosamine kinase, glucokinase-like [Rhodanobacteraceae bacterium]
MDAMVNHRGRNGHGFVQPFLAADVGGTHARLALVRASPADPRDLELTACRKLACGDYASLVDLLRAFLKAEAARPIAHCVLACAGQVIGDEVIHDNLAWPINVDAVQAALGFDELFVLNDFEALGYALADAERLHARLLCGPDVAAPGPKLVVGPGTGLGAAVCLPNAAGFVMATEAGQMDFAAQTLREREVLACLAPDGGYVPCERVLSGPGLLTLYRTLCVLNGASPWLGTPEAVTGAARQRTDASAAEAVDLFCAALGSFVGNLAMDFMARGGVYLAGGFLSAMFDLLQRSQFATRFLHGRSIRIFLERVPVRVMEHGRQGVLGAARYYLGRFALDRMPRERLAE